jgi:hypothetical protein
MRPYSPRRRARDRSYPQARIAVQERSQGLCEAGTSVCTGRLEQVHHKAGRTGPDPHALDRLLGVCAACHRYIESNRAESYERGWLIRRNGGAA